MTSTTVAYPTWGALLADLRARLADAPGRAALEASPLGRCAGGEDYGVTGGNGMREWGGLTGRDDAGVADALANLTTLQRPEGCGPARQRVRAQLRTVSRAAHTARSTRRRMRWDAEARGELSPDRLYGGRADAPFRAPGKRECPAAPRAVIVAAIDAPFSYSTDALAARGAAVAALAAELYAAGWRVSVRAQAAGEQRVEGGQYDGRLYILSWGLVHEGERVDVDRLADCLASPAAFRVAVFAAQAVLWRSANSRTRDHRPDDCTVYAGHDALADAAGWLATQRGALGLA